MRTTQCVATNSFSVARSTSGSVRPISFDRPAGGDGGASAGGASPLISSTDVSTDVSTNVSTDVSTDVRVYAHLFDFFGNFKNS